MAIRSKAQLDKFKQLVSAGQMSQQVFNEMMKGVIVHTFPDRITNTSPDSPFPVKLTKRHARKQRTPRARRAMPKKPRQRTKRKLPKKRMLPL